MGDTGTGKTSLTYQDLLDAEENGICCVVNDAKGGEVIARFYQPERGDVILNPTDDRCAYWNICGEGYDLATHISASRLLVRNSSVSLPSQPRMSRADDAGGTHV